MASKKNIALLFSLFLISFLILCSSCSLGTQLPSKGNGQPDSVQFEVTHASWINPAVTITDPKVVQQLYTKLYALSEMLSGPCTLVAGPTYILTFKQSGKILTIANIEKVNCQPVSIQGESKFRQLTDDFWNFLSQSIAQATATTKIARLSIQPFSETGQPTQQTAQITSAATAQSLYDTILALPPSDPNAGCFFSVHPAYQLIFYAANQFIPVQIDNTDCHSAILGAVFSDKRYRLNTQQFDQIVKKIASNTRFAPAQPDKLSITYNYYTQIEVHDVALTQNLYKKVLTLQPSSQKDCPSSDDSGKIYHLQFSQWGLPLQVLYATEIHSCTQITNIINNYDQKDLQGDAEFWNFVHQAVGQP